jgi:3-mercaptopyruvate sulfurtransferase SseA
VAQEFLKKGHEKVFALKGGWNAWVGAKLPTQEK